MNTRQTSIENTLKQALDPQELRITDDSRKHEGHAGARPDGQTHYTVEIVAEIFRGKSRVECHRMVNELLKDEFANGLHALAIKASAPVTG